MATLRRAALLGLLTLFVASAARAQLEPPSAHTRRRPAAAPPPPRPRRRRPPRRRPPPPPSRRCRRRWRPIRRRRRRSHAGGANRSAVQPPRPVPFYEKTWFWVRGRRGGGDGRDHPDGGLGLERVRRRRTRSSGTWMRSERLTRDRARAALCGWPPAVRTRESFIVLTLRTPATTPRRRSPASPTSGSTSPRGRREMRDAHLRRQRRDDRSGQRRTRCRSGSRAARRGNIDFEVDADEQPPAARSAAATTTKEIKKGGTAFVDVTLAPGHDLRAVDGGAPDGARGRHAARVRSGQPAEHRRTGTTCTATQTCQVDCVPPMDAPPRNECIAGGTGAPGTVCNTNADCQPGTQCFNYAITGCAVKVCLRFCNGTRTARRSARVAAARAASARARSCARPS